MRQLALVAVLVIGCGGDDDGGGGSVDAMSQADAFETICGEPGDTGNSMGVGKFCSEISDCSGQAANICAILGNPLAHFCTKICDPEMPVADTCGEDTTCECSGSSCGCTPASCTM